MLKSLHLARHLRARFARAAQPAPTRAAHGEEASANAAKKSSPPAVHNAALAALELPALHKKNSPQHIDTAVREQLFERIDNEASPGLPAQRLQKFRTMTLEVVEGEQWVASSYLYRGSFGAVSVAIDAAGQPWAVKVMRTQAKPRSKTQNISPSDFSSELKFTQKYLSTAAHAAVDADGEVYLFLPLHAGTAHDLTRSLQVEHSAQRAVVRNIGAQVAGHLAHMHTMGDLMFDLKPGNIVINHAGVAQISDFGAAISIADMQAKCATDTWEIPGTPLFAALEWRQAFVHGSNHLGVLQALDVWALGMTLLDMSSSLTSSPFCACVNPVAQDVLQDFFAWRATMLTDGAFDMARLQAAHAESDAHAFTGYFQEVARQDFELCSLLLRTILTPAASRADAASVYSQLRALQPEDSEAGAQAHRAVQAWAQNNRLQSAVLDVLRTHPSRATPPQSARFVKKPFLLRLLELAHLSIATKA